MIEDVKIIDPAEQLSGGIFKGGMVFDFVFPTDIDDRICLLCWVNQLQKHYKVIIGWRKVLRRPASEVGYCEMRS